MSPQRRPRHGSAGRGGPLYLQMPAGEPHGGDHLTSVTPGGPDAGGRSPTQHLTASRLTTASSPTTSARCTAPRGTATDIAGSERDRLTLEHDTEGPGEDGVELVHTGACARETRYLEGRCIGVTSVATTARGELRRASSLSGPSRSLVPVLDVAHQSTTSALCRRSTVTRYTSGPHAVTSILDDLGARSSVTGHEASAAILLCQAFNVRARNRGQGERFEQRPEPGAGPRCVPGDIGGAAVNGHAREHVGRSPNPSYVVAPHDAP